MYFRCLKASLLFLVASGAAENLRVCADPNNLPFSNQSQEGFENKLATLVSRELGLTLEYTWWVERKSYVKNTLEAGRCDVLLGVPAGLEAVEETEPYYRSSYVFVTRKDRDLRIESLNDPRLERLRIGVHIVGDDYAPPAIVLGRRGLGANLVAYSLFGSYGEKDPPAKLIDAVERGDVDVGVAWGPLAGYFSQRVARPLEVVPVKPAVYLSVPFTYPIAMAVRKGDTELRDRINRVLEMKSAEIRVVLERYGVPLV